LQTLVKNFLTEPPSKNLTEILREYQQAYPEETSPVQLEEPTAKRINPMFVIKKTKHHL